MGGIVPRTIIEEEDGSPTGQFSTLKFPNSTLTDNGDGTATYTPAASGGSTPVIPMSWHMNANFLSTTTPAGSMTVTTSNGTVAWNAGGYVVYQSSSNANGAAATYIRAHGSVGNFTGNKWWDKNPMYWVLINLKHSTNVLGGGTAWSLAGSGTALSLAANQRQMGFSLAITLGVGVVNAYNSTTSAATTSDISANTSSDNAANNDAYDKLVAVMTSGTNIKFYANNTLVATHTTNLPSGQPSDDVWTSTGITTNAAAINHEMRLRACGLSFDAF